MYCAESVYSSTNPFLVLAEGRPTSAFAGHRHLRRCLKFTAASRFRLELSGGEKRLFLTNNILGEKPEKKLVWAAALPPQSVWKTGARNMGHSQFLNSHQRRGCDSGVHSKSWYHWHDLMPVCPARRMGCAPKT